jgi:hypothetical protein
MADSELGREVAQLTPAAARTLATVRAELDRLVRYGGDARRFRRGMRARFGDDEVAAWRYCEQTLTPVRLRIRQVARALLVHPRYLPYQVVAAIADGA